jgi:hypothetical protein
MSVETSRTNQPGDGDPDDEHTFGYRSADSAAADDDLEDDDPDDETVSRHDETVASRDEDNLADEDETVVHGTVYDSNAADYGTTDSSAGDYGTAGSDPVVTDVEDPQPTFTPADDGPVTDVPDPSAPTLSETDNVPVVPVSDQAATEAPLSSAADLDPNAPLLGDPVGLRASWQQAQAGFVDDPRAAVAEAAELVEHTAQTLIGSLQQRQRALRTQWDDNGSAGAATTSDLSDTEQLRHLMQDYRNLFNQLCRP